MADIIVPASHVTLIPAARQLGRPGKSEFQEIPRIIALYSTFLLGLTIFSYGVTINDLGKDFNTEKVQRTALSVLGIFTIISPYALNKRFISFF